LPGRLEEFRQKVAGTNIDQRSLLSTDYFNTFNSVIMLFDMLPEMPELLDEIDQWQFYDYVDHFKQSGLDFANLAIEAYPYAPSEIRDSFERKINGMRVFVEEAARMLRRLHEAGEMTAFNIFSRHIADMCRQMISEGGSIVHGQNAILDQHAIDSLF
jgi:hypothetical protein